MSAIDTERTIDPDSLSVFIAAFAVGRRCRLTGNPFDFQLTVIHDCLFRAQR